MPTLADRPRPNAAQVDAAIGRIRNRHRHDDYHLDDGDPEGVLTYLRKQGTGGLGDGPAGTHDALDALILVNALYWRYLDHERWVLRAAESLGLNRRRVGALLGLAAGQAVVDRLARLTARLNAAAAALEAEATMTATAAPADQPEALTELAVALHRNRAVWWTDDTADDLFVDPELLAEKLMTGGDLRPTLATLLAELDDVAPGWRGYLDSDAAAALDAASPHLTAPKF